MIYIAGGNDLNTAPKLEKHNIILRQPVEGDIFTRVKLGLNMECVMMCGGEINNCDEFTQEDAIKWYEKLIQHPCKWIIKADYIASIK